MVYSPSMSNKIAKATEQLEKSRCRVRVFQVAAMRPGYSPQEIRALGALERTQRTIVRLRRRVLADLEQLERAQKG